MTTVTNTSGVTANPYASSSDVLPAIPKASDRSSTVSSDQFLKLLVAQLKYQDPSSPQDPAAFMTQTAQFTELESMQKIEKALTQSIAVSRTTAATALLGKTVTGKPSNAIDGVDTAPVTGVVKSIAMGTDGPVLKVGTSEIPYANVTEATT